MRFHSNRGIEKYDVETSNTEIELTTSLSPLLQSALPTTPSEVYLYQLCLSRATHLKL